MVGPDDTKQGDDSAMDEVRARIRAARLVPPAAGSMHDGTGPLDLPLSRLARNDIGNAERFIRRVGQDFKFLQEGDWMRWDGQRWDRELGPVEAQKAAQSVAIAIRNEANALNLEGPDYESIARRQSETEKEHLARVERAHDARVESLRKHANTSGNTGKLTAMLGEARPHQFVKRDAVDANYWLFNAADMTIELLAPGLEPAEGALPFVARAPSRDDLITLRGAAKFPKAIFAGAFDRAAMDAAVAAAAPIFHAFLTTVQPDQGMRAYLQRIAGYMLTGSTAEQQLFLNLGRGANGKGTFYEALAYALGDYAAPLGIEAIRQDAQRNGSGPRPELARLPGRRLVYISEAEENEKLAEGQVKKLTGEDIVSVRDLFKGQIDFHPQFKIVIYLNGKPLIKGTDDGIWRRIRLIDWPVKIPEAERDLQLKEKLRAEADGILAWALLGFMEWREKGLAAPKSVVEATNEYRAERDHLSRFVEDLLLPAPGFEIGATEMYEAYEKLWCPENGVDPMSLTGFGREIVKRTARDASGEGPIAKAKKGTIRYVDLMFDDKRLQALRDARSSHKAASADPGPQSEDDYGDTR